MTSLSPLAWSMLAVLGFLALQVTGANTSRFHLRTLLLALFSAALQCSSCRPCNLSSRIRSLT